MKTKIKNKILTVLVPLTALLGQAQHQHEHHDRPSVHGMLVFGKEEIYFSHLPMFHAPHNYQALLKMNVSAEVQELYKQQKKDQPDLLLTFVPERFSLTKIGTGELTKFNGVFYAGHFERGGTPFTENVEVEIKEVLEFTKFDENATHDAKAFFLVGTPDDAYLVHKVKKAPDFDEVLAVDRLMSDLKALLAGKSIVPVTIHEREDANQTGDDLFKVWIPEPVNQMPVYSFVKSYYREENELSE